MNGWAIVKNSFLPGSKNLCAFAPLRLCVKKGTDWAEDVAPDGA
jgi:hypothetical protein